MKNNKRLFYFFAKTVQNSIWQHLRQIKVNPVWLVYELKRNVEITILIHERIASGAQSRTVEISKVSREVSI